MNFHNFDDEASAQEFGSLVSRAVFLTCARSGIGIDAGDNRPRGGVGKIIVEELAAKGTKVMPNVHGLLVYEREGNEIFFHGNANATVSIDPTVLTDNLPTSFRECVEIGEREQTALTLLAMSKMTADPLAEAALCISAVEFLSSELSWTPAQLDLLASLKIKASDSEGLPEVEAMEVADAVGRVFKSIRQSAKRKIFALGLTEADWRLFDDVYGLRSKIFHGSIVRRDRHSELAAKAREICTRIIIAAVEKVRDGALTEL